MNFQLESSFIERVKVLPSPLKDNIIGDIVYRRTYSRTKEDGTKEEWWETVARVVNGTYSIQKDHIQRLGVGWNEEQAQKSAQEMYYLIFNMYFLPPGRGLWVMGTDIVHKRKLGMALSNCSFISTEGIEGMKDPTTPFRFLMDVSMLGVGCGADTKGRDKIKLYNPVDNPTKFVIDDTREGWVDSVSSLLNSYFKEGQNKITFDYSKIRKEGERLKTFGGISSGPAPLIELHEKLNEILSSRDILDSTTIVDIFNLIGKAVVSGNVRRCIPKGTLVHTKRGLVCIENIVPGKDITVTAGGEYNISALVPQGEQEILTILTEAGNIRVSNRHKMKIFNSDNNTEFKPANKLVAGDRLVFSQHKINNTDTKKLNNSWFKGYYLGKVNGSNNDTNCKFVFNTMHGNGIHMLRICKEESTELGMGYEENLDVDRKITLRFGECSVPISSVFESSREERQAFLAGLLDSGAVGNEIASTDIKFLENIQSIFATVGVLTYVNKFHNPHIYSLKFKKLTKTITGCSFKYDKYETTNKTGCVPIKVIGLLYTGDVEETYDLTVDEVHEFAIESGAVVSNTAELMIGDYDDIDFLDLKNYEKNPQRCTYGWTSNNSVFAELGMDYKEIGKRIEINGEPGIAWLENMRAYSRMKDVPDYKDIKVKGANPCFPIDTKIMTSEGIRSFRDLVGTPFKAVVDGIEYPTTSKGVFKTAEQQDLFRITLDNGISIRATNNHKFHTETGLKRLDELLINKDELVISNNTNYNWGGIGTKDEGYLLGWLIGDGTFAGMCKGHQDLPKAVVGMWISKDKYNSPTDYKPFNKIQEIIMNLPSKSNTKGLNLARETDKYWEFRSSTVSLSKMAKSWNICPKTKNIPLYGSREFNIGLLQGLFDSDGTVGISESKKNSYVRLSQNNTSRLQQVQQLLLTLGIGSKIYNNRREENLRLLPDGVGGEKEYLCKALHELNISSSNLVLFNDIIGYLDNTKKESLNIVRTPRKYNYRSKVVSIEQDGVEDVYCCTVDDDRHTVSVEGLSASNCVEQSLESHEVCCLVEVFPAKHSSIEQYLRTLKYAYLYAKTVTLQPTHWPETTSIVFRNRRIGTGLSGIAKFLAKHNNNMEVLKLWLEKGYDTIRKWDDMYSNWMCIPKSIKVTTVKPSGTVSLLADEPPGVHFPNSEYYYRRIRVGNNDPLIEDLKKDGYHIEPCFGSETTTSVVRIPKYVGENVRTLDDVSMWLQLGIAAFLQKHWSDNQVSCTVTFDPKTEGPHIASALDVYQYQLKAISFLPRCEGVYPQMPYEKITKDQYEKELKEIEERRGESPSRKRRRIIQEKQKEEIPDSILYCDGDKCML